MAAVLANSFIDQPGWHEARKFAGRAFAAETSSLAKFEETSSLAVQAVSTSEPLMRWVDALISNLSDLRQLIASKDADNLIEVVKRALTGREKWIMERNVGDWAAVEDPSKVELPTIKDIFARMFSFGGERKPKRPK